MTTDRCTGHCCREMPIPISPEDLEEERQKLEHGGVSRWQSGEHLHELLAGLRTEAREDGTPRFLYSCRFHDQATGNCLNYEERPPMCQDYPYGRACHRQDCTWEAGRLGLHPPHLFAHEQLKRCPDTDPRFRLFQRRYMQLDDAWAATFSPDEEPR